MTERVVLGSYFGRSFTLVGSFLVVSWAGGFLGSLSGAGFGRSRSIFQPLSDDDEAGWAAFSSFLGALYFCS